MVSARLSSLTDCSQLTSWLSEYAWSSTVRITSTCPLPKMRPDHALAPRTSNPPVAGSNPAGRATENGRLAGISLGQLVVGDLTWLAIHQLSHQCGGVRKRYEQPRILESPGQPECLRAGG